MEYDDDIGVARGEGWTVISSEQKGTTEVLVGASTETNWDRQYQKILVHWIDAQWQFPTSVSGNAGSDQVLTTTVTRPSDNTPLSGWTIRYKLVSNRKATLSSPSNNEQLDTIDVTTDANGQAAIRVTPNGNQAGIVYVTTKRFDQPTYHLKLLRSSLENRRALLPGMHQDSLLKLPVLKSWNLERR